MAGSSTTWQDVIEAHTETDSYCNGCGESKRSPRLWWTTPLCVSVQGFLAAYLVTVALKKSRYAVSTAGGLVEYRSPEGLSMTLHDRFPKWFLAVHKWAGVALVPLCVLQKHIVPRMKVAKQCTTKDAAESAERARRAHVIVGYAALGAMGYMAAGGFFLRSKSTFSGFQWAMLLFVAPWIMFLGLVPMTVWQGWKTAHAIIGGAVFKACVAVPVARTLGVIFQRVWSSEALLARNYYLGIAASAVVVGVWAVRDAVAMLKYTPEGPAV